MSDGFRQKSSNPIHKTSKRLQWKLLILPLTISLHGTGKNQRNHRVSKIVHGVGQPCCLALDYIRQLGFVTFQSGSRLDIPRGCTHRHLRHTKVPGLPSTLLPLQKMHIRLRQNNRIVLRQTQPQRLQRNLRRSRSRLLLHSAWSISNCSSARFHRSNV